MTAFNVFDHNEAESVSGAVLNGGKLVEANAPKFIGNEIGIPPSASKDTAEGPTSAGASDAIDMLAVNTPAWFAVNVWYVRSSTKYCSSYSQVDYRNSSTQFRHKDY